jgi:hypothetical protein
LTSGKCLPSVASAGNRVPSLELTPRVSGNVLERRDFQPSKKLLCRSARRDPSLYRCKLVYYIMQRIYISSSLTGEGAAAGAPTGLAWGTAFTTPADTKSMSIKTFILEFGEITD